MAMNRSEIGVEKSIRVPNDKEKDRGVDGKVSDNEEMCYSFALTTLKIFPMVHSKQFACQRYKV